MKNLIVVIYVLITLAPVAIGVMTHLDHVGDREAFEACLATIPMPTEGCSSIRLPADIDY